MNKPIILTEYPKSGGSWIVSMIGDALEIPKRDIYVRPGFDLFEIAKHPWYTETNKLDFPARSVIKSHELPDSPLIDFAATYIHLVRDGRDVVVSKWFFDKEFCVKNGITTSFDKNFDDYVAEVAKEWAKYIFSWAAKGFVTVHYENFLADPEKTLGVLLKQVLGFDIQKSVLEEAVSKHTKKKFSDALSKTFKHNTFVRKGVSGDWKNHFSKKNIESFNSVAKDAMSLLGYEL